MTRVRALPVVDQLDRDGERVVLVVGRAVRVVGLAPVILDLAGESCDGRDGCDIADLVTGLQARFGDAPDGDAERLVRTAVEELAAVGLLEVE